ncbi:MAG: DNA polymerase IV [Gemmatimonadetes bacterium]|nr:DNA polymerase IV [Gemmatimonadota bacterium]
MRRILLADADAFFVAVARQVDPDGAGRAPLLIVGGRPGSRGVVCSASYETRAFGVRSAMPISQALRLCPDAMCVPVPRQACSDTSRAIRRVLEAFTPAVEGASIDEWYLDLTGTEALYRHEPLEATARRIRAAVIEATGLSVSIGGGPNKLVAKLAAERAKPSKAPDAGGVRIVDPGDVAAFMATLALGEIPGIGPKLQERLHKLGLTRVEQVLEQDLATLERWTDKKTAAWLWHRVRGESDTVVEPRAPAKQVSREETFGRDLTDRALLETELRRLCAKVAADLRGDGLAARTVTVKYRTNDWTTRTAGRTLPEAVESDRAVTDVALELLAKLRQTQRKPARLVGVALSNFRAARDAEQLTIFGEVANPVEAPRDRDLSRALDAVRAKFGDSAIRSGPPRATPLGEKGARRPR